MTEAVEVTIDNFFQTDMLRSVIDSDERIKERDLKPRHMRVLEALAENSGECSTTGLKVKLGVSTSTVRNYVNEMAGIVVKNWPWSSSNLSTWVYQLPLDRLPEECRIVYDLLDKEAVPEVAGPQVAGGELGSVAD